MTRALSIRERHDNFLSPRANIHSHQRYNNVNSDATLRTTMMKTNTVRVSVDVVVLLSALVVLQPLNRYCSHAFCSVSHSSGSSLMTLNAKRRKGQQPRRRKKKAAKRIPSDLFDDKLDGTPLPPPRPVPENQPCLCSSGKKYNQCCGLIMDVDDNYHKATPAEVVRARFAAFMVGDERFLLKSSVSNSLFLEGYAEVSLELTAETLLTGRWYLLTMMGGMQMSFGGIIEDAEDSGGNTATVSYQVYIKRGALFGLFGSETMTITEKDYFVRSRLNGIWQFKGSEASVDLDYSKK